ncbi:UBC-like protein [Aulographum hederae CBS 113979]|uniref:Ubiquitin-conjugating enzyme E2 Z n=1 Tax=Aulographum hederae CBS 113979 TaxID=1176131 RepID=A0A6G1HFY9_9PEZI|nr:UBC-like protein [Aulographum hederae CBS 113979]
MSNQSILRITRELNEIQRGDDLSLAVAIKDVDVRHVRALIIGPSDTPYEFGFFEFAVRFGKEYPTKAPTVNAVTTNGGRTRFNPNIYAQGKVCLSILGTWRGERGEEWSSAQGLESILISIQSLMSGNPYENEPGFEDANTEYDKTNQANYVAKIRHETLRISVLDRLEGYLNIKGTGPKAVTPYKTTEAESSEALDEYAPFEPFKDRCKRRFLWYYDSYIKAIDEESKKHKDGKSFEKMPFEGPSNTMDGTFQYTELRRRMNIVHQKLEEEVQAWAAEGMEAVKKELTIATNLQRQFEQTQEGYKRNCDVQLELELCDKNPFVWNLLLFGKMMTNLDGGMFRIKMFISPRFPQELPRVKVETPIFHHRVSKDGTLFYLDVKRIDDLGSYVDAIVRSLQDEDPKYDPRTLVNPEAAQLLWGTSDEKKQYSRKLRRSVQDSSEFC